MSGPGLVAPMGLRLHLATPGLAAEDRKREKSCDSSNGRAKPVFMSGNLMLSLPEKAAVGVLVEEREALGFDAWKSGAVEQSDSHTHTVKIAIVSATVRSSSSQALH